MQLTVDIPEDLARQMQPDGIDWPDVIRRGLRRPSTNTGEIFAFLADNPSAEKLLSYRPSEKALERLRLLLDRSKAGELAAEEEAELDTLEIINDLVALLKVQARRSLVRA